MVGMDDATLDAIFAAVRADAAKDRPEYEAKLKAEAQEELEQLRRQLKAEAQEELEQLRRELKAVAEAPSFAENLSCSVVQCRVVSSSVE